MKITMLALLVGLALLAVPASAADSPVQIEGPAPDAKGLDVFTVTSPFTAKPNRVDVLLPDTIEQGRTYRTLYVLPVGGEWADKPPWGNGLDAVQSADAHNCYRLICVSMEFDSVPWYGSHAADPKIRHDRYIKEVVVPLIESRYPASGKPADRLLIGFSKSGWGAVSLLLRDPDFFGAACSWDAPLMMTEQDLKWGSRQHFGTPEAAAPYVPVTLVGQRADQFAGGPARLTILGHDFFGSDTRAFHNLLEAHRVPHRYDDTLKFKHGWESGWLPRALEIFLGPPPAAPSTSEPRTDEVIEPIAESPMDDSAKKDPDPDYPKVDKARVPLIKAMESGIAKEPATLPWRLFVPPQATDENKLPLVFFLHGAGRRGDDNVGPMDLAYTFWSPEAQKEHPCFVLAPQCRRGTMWTKMTPQRTNFQADEDPTPEMAAALAVLETIIKERPVDEKRIYVAGQSMGGFGTWDALFRRPNLWAAAIPICGGGDPAKAALYKDVPVWAWHGANDTSIPPECSRELIAALKEAGGNPKYTELPNVGHGSWVQAFSSPELYAWLFAQKRK